MKIIKRNNRGTTSYSSGGFKIEIGDPVSIFFLSYNNYDMLKMSFSHLIDSYNGDISGVVSDFGEIEEVDDPYSNEYQKKRMEKRIRIGKQKALDLLTPEDIAIINAIFQKIILDNPSLNGKIKS